MSEASIVPAAVETRVIVHRLDGSEEDLGIVAAQYSDPEQQADWERNGRPAAKERIEEANARLIQELTQETNDGEH